MNVRDAKVLRKAPLETPMNLGPSAVRDISGALNVLLADLFGLYMKTKNFHWHISGRHFRDYHLLLDEQATQIFATTDDSAERGMLFACIGASLRRQFEFVQQEWVNSGIFLDHNGERDPLCGANNGTGVFTIPERPIRRRIHELPTFIVTRGGEYFFMPGLSALRWLADQHR